MGVAAGFESSALMTLALPVLESSHVVFDIFGNGSQPINQWPTALIAKVTYSG